MNLLFYTTSRTPLRADAPRCSTTHTVDTTYNERLEFESVKRVRSALRSGLCARCSRPELYLGGWPPASLSVRVTCCGGVAYLRGSGPDSQNSYPVAYPVAYPIGGVPSSREIVCSCGLLNSPKLAKWRVPLSLLDPRTAVHANATSRFPGHAGAATHLIQSAIATSQQLCRAVKVRVSERDGTICIPPERLARVEC